MAFDSSRARVVDPVLTTVVHGFKQAGGIAGFAAPIVPVSLRAGNIVKFGKENFAIRETRRAPGGNIARVSVAYGSEKYSLNQHAAAGEVPREWYEEAKNSEARVDLRKKAAFTAASTVMQSWEAEVIETITNAALYEPSNVVALAGADQFSNSASDPEAVIQTVFSVIRRQVGLYPNRAIIDDATYNVLRRHPIFRDRTKYTSSASVNLKMLAEWFELEEIRVAKRLKLDAAGNLVDMFPRGTIWLSYSPESSTSDAIDGLVPADESNVSEPAAFYTYQLDGYPIAEEERFDEDRKVFVTDLIAEQAIQPVGLGNSGKVGAAALITNVIA